MPTTRAPMDIDTAARLRLAVMRLARRLRQQAPGGATPSQLSALATLDIHGPLTLGELAERERVRPPTMTRIVTALEDGELVERRADPTDRRIARVGLTRKGRSFVDRARKRKTAYLTTRMAALSEEDAEALARAVDVLEHLVEDER